MLHLSETTLDFLDTPVSSASDNQIDLDRETTSVPASSHSSEPSDSQMLSDSAFAPATNSASAPVSCPISEASESQMLSDSASVPVTNSASAPVSCPISEASESQMLSDSASVPVTNSASAPVSCPSTELSDSALVNISISSNASGTPEPSGLSATLSLANGQATVSEIDVNDIKLPPKMRKRGRPKGAGQTVVGVSKKRKLQHEKVFTNLSNTQKTNTILGWIVGEVDAEVMSGEVKISVDEFVLSHSLLESCVDIKLVKKFFERPSWKALKKALKKLKKNSPHPCGSCKGALNEHRYCVSCDSCLVWHHYQCVGLTKKPKSLYWFCSKCN